MRKHLSDITYMSTHGTEERLMASKKGSMSQHKLMAYFSMGHDLSVVASKKEHVPGRTKVESCSWDTPDHSVSGNVDRAV